MEKIFSDISVISIERCKEYEKYYPKLKKPEVSQGLCDR